MRLHTLIVRHWARRPGRPAAAVAGVAVAVGAIVATWTAADASRAGYRRLTAEVGGASVLDVVAADGGRFAAGRVPSLAGIHGVRAVVPLVSRPTLLRAGGARLREIAVGVDVEPLVAAGLLELVAGAACTRPDEIVLDAELAGSLGVGVGAEVLVVAGLRVRRSTVTGLAAGRSLRWIAEAGSVVMDIHALAALTAQASAVDRFRLVLDAAVSRAAVLREVRRRLPDGLRAEVPAGVAALADDVMHAANLGLDFVTALTAAMAWFIVRNAMLMSVAERRRGLALVRLLGATGGTIRRLVVWEAIAVGALGAVLGAVGGLLAARPIAAGISRALEAPHAAPAFDGPLVALALAVGVCGTVVTTWWPAREAAALDLLDGLSRAPRPPARGTAVRALAGAAGLVATAAAVLALVTAEWVPPRAAVAASVLVLVGFVVATGAVLRPVAVAVGAVVPRRWRVEKSLAVGRIARQPLRTALTSGVLVVAVTNGIGLGHAIHDNVADIRGWFDRALRADWILVQAGPPVSSAPGGGRGLAETMRGLPGVAGVEGIGIAGGRIAGAACAVVARDVPDDEPLPLKPVARTEAEVRAALARGEAVVGTLLARRAGLAVGDEVVVDVLGRSTKVRIAALVVDYTAGGGSLVLRSDAASRQLGLSAEGMLLIRGLPGRAADLGATLGDFARAHGLLLRSFAGYRRQIDGMVEGVVGSLWSILTLGFMMGSLGVANTVTMNVVEQTRTLGLLRAVGMTGGQVKRMVVLDGAVIGAAGAAVGLVGGLTTSAFIQAASQPLLGHPIRFTVRPDIIAATLTAALVVAVAAAWVPARRAARLDVLDAISVE